MKEIDLKIPKARLSFINIFEKQPIDGQYVTKEEERKYSITLLLDKSCKEHVKAVKLHKEYTEKLLKEMKLKTNSFVLLVDGDEEYSESIGDDSKLSKISYKKNNFLLTAKNKMQPIIHDIKKNDLTEDNGLFYSGCYAHVKITLRPFKFKNKWKGICNSLHYLRFYKEGERFGSSLRSGVNDFDEFDEPSKTIDPFEADEQLDLF